MARKTFKKQITSKEKIESINPRNKKLINLFIKDKSRKCSVKTIEGYVSDLNIFFCWVLDYCDNKYFPLIKKYEFSDFFSFTVDELKWNGKRFSRMRSVLSGLSDTIIKYLEEEEDECKNYRNVINSIIEPIPKENVRDKTVLEVEQLQLLLDTLTEKGLYCQACVLALAAYSGCRVAELVQFKTDTLSLDNLAYSDMFLETTHKIRTKGFGKQGKQIHKFVLKELFMPYYERYLEYRSKMTMEKGIFSDKLFLQRSGKEVTVTTIQSWVKTWGDILETDIYAHCFRHLFCTYLYNLKISKELIISLVGWAGSSGGQMADIYIDIDEKDKDWSKDLAKLEQVINKEE